MHLQTADYLVIAIFFAINIGIGIYYARRGGKSLGEFFLSGRSVPWWLAGTSMVATTFAADTPLAVTGFVVKNGVAGNWLWWNMVMSGMLTVFFFAALWRRSGVLTDVEFIELRYAGKAAAALRGVRAVYQGVIINTIIIGWVNLAIAKILGLTLHLPKWEAILICLVLTGLYVAIGGLWSVLVTDFLQFIVKMSMVIVLAVAAVAAVGGIASMKTHLAALDAVHQGSGGASILAFFPTGNAAWMPLLSFIVFISVSWWASSYPGAEPGGGGYIAQRIFASKDEKNAIWATLFFNVAHYALRPWPWILVALASVILYPHGVQDPITHKIDPELNYIQTMIDYLPAWLRGLMMAGFLAAYMSTVGTQLNLGASYFVNDLYRRFMRPQAPQSELVWASRAATIVAMFLAAIVTIFMDSVGGAWAYILTFTAGVGLVMILRWYWWRINAWTEISALLASGLTASFLQMPGITLVPDGPNKTVIVLLITVAVTTVVWVSVTFLTKPEPAETLDAFYRKVQPAAFGWRPVADRVGTVNPNTRLGLSILDWIAGCGLVYFTLFGIGKVVLAETFTGILLLVAAAICLAFIFWDMNRRDWEGVDAVSLRAAAVASVVIAVLMTVAFWPAKASADAADKQLQNLLGNVTYTHGTATSPLATKASIMLADKDYAQTGDKSRGAVTLPDSSVVTFGSNTKVQLAFFNQAAAATAKFILFNGQTRFAVRHPQGAKASYTFATSTASIAVRGTEGDIGVTDDSLQLNVYEVCDPELPVVVTTKSGQKFTVHAKEALLAQIANGVVRAKVEALTAELMNRFTGDIGFPAIPSMDEFKGQVQGEAESAVDNATGNIGVASAIGGLFKHKAQAAASPAPETSCS